MSFKKFILSRTFLKHFAVAVALISVLTFITMQSLKGYTHHGESHLVPDFSGMSVQEAVVTADAQSVRIEVADSVYSEEVPPGVIVDQVPEAGFKVKQNRVVFLTINSMSPEQVALPKLTDISFRQAQVLVENSGLQVGQIFYQPSEYNDLVLNVQIDSVDIFPGKMLNKGTSVNLIIGRTHGNTETPLPDLTGLTREETRNTLTNAMLNLGVSIFDKTVITKQDSLDALVWKQQPSTDVTQNVYLGSSVDIWLTLDTAKFQTPEEPDFEF